MAMNQAGFEKDYKEMEKRYERTVKAILGNFFFIKDIKKDTKEGTDFATYASADETRTALRLRRKWVKRNGIWINQLKQYGQEFTIRIERPSGIDTEIHKIRKHYVKYFLYGFVSEKINEIVQYFIADLNEFLKNEPDPIKTYWNKPPDSRFAVYQLNQFPASFIKKFYQKSNT